MLENCLSTELTRFKSNYNVHWRTQLQTYAAWTWHLFCSHMTKCRLITGRVTVNRWSKINRHRRIWKRERKQLLAFKRVAFDFYGLWLRNFKWGCERKSWEDCNFLRYPVCEEWENRKLVMGECNVAVTGTNTVGNVEVFMNCLSCAETGLGKGFSKWIAALTQKCQRDWVGK